MSAFTPQFHVGDVVEYNMVASHYKGAPEGWFLGTITSIDEDDPEVPWLVQVRAEHEQFTHEPDGECWFYVNNVRRPELIIEEEP